MTRAAAQAPEARTPHARSASVFAAAVATTLAVLGATAAAHAETHTFALDAPAAHEVFLAGEMTDWAARKRPMSRDASGRWSVDVDLGPGQWLYKFVVDGRWIADPATADRDADGSGGEHSYLFVGDGDWAERPGVPKGRVETHAVRSQALRREMKVNVYLPPGFDAARDYPVLWLLHGGRMDADQWYRTGHVERYMDNLLARGAIRPFVIVMPSGGDDPYVGRSARFVADELPAWLATTYGVRADRARTAIAGMSLGGTGAVALSLGRPAQYGYAFALSGAYPDKLIAQVPKDGRLPMQLAMLTGRDDALVVEMNRAMARALRERNATFVYREDPGGHTWQYWSHRVVEMLTGADAYFREAERAAAPLTTAAPAAASAPTAATTAAPAFDAPRAWGEFTTLVTEEYGYFQRPGVDGPAILAAFAERALAAPTREAFRDVLKLAGRNFADPHFLVGPLHAGDYSVIPTSSDLYAARRGDGFVVLDARAGGAAAAAGLGPGARIVAIDGEAPPAAAARLLGRPYAALSEPQVDFALNLALAGPYRSPRTVVARTPDGERTFRLAPTSEFSKAVAAAPRVAFERRGEIAIVRLGNSLGDMRTIDEFAAAVAQAAGTKALVIDLRNTPSGGNTTVARGIMGHFTTRERPYQVHVVPSEQRRYGVPRKFVEYVLPRQPYYGGRVFVIGGRWTGSMGEGLMIGFDALGATTVGSELGHLLGALYNVDLATSGARVDLGLEQLFHVDGTPRERFRPKLYVEPVERTTRGDPALDAIEAALRR